VREEVARKEAAHDRALRDYAAVTGALRLGVDLDVVLGRIVAAARTSPLSADEIAHVNEAALSVYVDEALADDVVTPEENALIARAAERLGVQIGPAQWARYSVAASNAGILPRVAQPRILLNADEIDLIEAEVALLTERVITERRTTYNSLSVPIGSSGIRYRTGQARGRTVVVGTRTEVADRGVLAVTSDRVVFAGASQVMEFPYHRLVGLRVFGDGLGLQIANRKSVPTFRTGAPMNDMLAAVLGTAVAMNRGTFAPPAAAPVRRLATPPPPLPSGEAARSPAAPALESAPTPDAPRTDPSPRPAGDADAAARMLLEIGRFPGRPPETAALEAAHSVGAVTPGQLEQALRHLHEAAVAEELPAALTPYPPGERPPSAGEPFIRDVTPDLDAALAGLRELGLTPWQAAELRDDWRRGLATDAQLGAVWRVLSRRIEEPPDIAAEPSEVAGAKPDETPPGAYYLLNTNAGNDARDDADMLAHAKAAAFFDPWKYQIERLAKGDAVFLYRTGEGIVAFGHASGQLEMRAYHGEPENADEEYAMALEGFTRLETPLSAAEIKQVAERNVSFRQTMAALPDDAGARLLAAARARAA
jgi:hypothetical protein